jgi:hypothetical protein
VGCSQPLLHFDLDWPHEFHYVLGVLSAGMDVDEFGLLISNLVCALPAIRMVA